MFEYISGTLQELSPTQAVIDCGGVGFLLEISLSTYEAIEAQKGGSVRLLAHSVIREDAHQLYGFATPDERQLFRQLIAISGVGPNTARMMFSTLSVGELRTAIAHQDVRRIQHVKGIGAKTAQRIALELHDKVTASSSVSAATSGQLDEATAALVMLGFAKPAIQKVFDSLSPLQIEKSTVEELIKTALQKLS